MGVLWTTDPLPLAILFLAAACSMQHPADGSLVGTDAEYLEIGQVADGGWNVVSVSPFDGSRDTLAVGRPMGRLVVMSTSYVGFLEAIGGDSAIVGVSGLEYVHGGGSPADVLAAGSLPPSEGRLPPLAERAVDVGYDAAPDYEKIVALHPDLVLTYAVSSAKSPFLTKLRSLGIRVLVVNEHLERHPLARASYIRLFGAITGRMEQADSVLSEVESRYLALADSVAKAGVVPRKVLLNIPYGDQWFVPSPDNYLTAMIKDAGGKVLGSEPGKVTSSSMSLERAYSLGKEADCWLNVGWCSSMDQLLGANPIFPDMVARIKANASAIGRNGRPVVWNDNKRLNPKGGNDIWESGVVRPDLVLKDLVGILHPSGSASGSLYYRPLD